MLSKQKKVLNPNFEEETIRTVGAKDIINIRSDFNSVKLDGKRVISSDDNYNLDYVSDFYTYLTTVFKKVLNPNFEEETIRTVGAKDIINIRSDFNSVKLDGKRVISSDDNYNLDYVSDFYTYLTTVLIELDPLED